MLPLSAFLAQFTRTFGVINQVYFVQEATLDNCAIECILPEVDNINKTIGSCCRPPKGYFNQTICAALDIDLFADNSESIYYVQDPFNNHCLVWIDYCVIVTACIPMASIVIFALWSAYYTVKFGPRGVRHYVNAIIDMGFPKDMNELHYSAYYGDIEYVRSVIQRKDIQVNDEMQDGNTALHLAATNGFSEICYILVKEFDGDIDVKNNEGHTPAGLAKIEGYELIYRYLTKKMEDKRKCKANATRSKSLKLDRPGAEPATPVWSPLPTSKKGHRRIFSDGGPLFQPDGTRKRPTTLNLAKENPAFDQIDTFGDATRDTFDDRDTKTSTTLDSFTDIDQKNSLPFYIDRFYNDILDE